MKGATALALTFLLTLGLLPDARAQASPWPHLFAAKSLIDRVWRPDGQGCIQYSCGYWYGGIHVTAGYDLHNRAIEFDTDRYRRPGDSKYWRFLTSLLPSGARLQACRSFKRAGAEDENMGPARACVYRYGGKPILVAQWLTAHPPDTPPALGLVMWDMGFIYMKHPDAP
ncbi:MAG: hypothetical protein JOZ41_11400 [Chloroflexi bacterium]|nr:hypothetical protein [Chloroflexota bacterium]